jgi:hypothetical protein
MLHGGLDVLQFRDRVLRPVVGYLQLGGDEDAAINLLLGTAAQESAFRYLAQVPSGPGVGLFQMEPATLEDLFESWLSHRPALLARVLSFAAPGPDRRVQLAGNHLFAAAAARLQYFRQPDPLPAAADIDGLARYWKRFWNTEKGKGSVAEFVTSWRRLVAPALERSRP